MIAGFGLAESWSKAFLELLHAPSHEVSPLFLRIAAADGNHLLNEDPGLRAALDALLATNDKYKSVDTIANTIFPQTRWLIAGQNRSEFFAKYNRDYPRIKRLDIQNRKGTYFGRMVEPIAGVPEGQLEHIIGIYSRLPSAVRMKLQLSIFDPIRDHERGARPSFPCMQQISFAPHDATLDVNAFYASQQFLLKGYGNYLGLTRLGQFMASQMGLQLRSVNVFAGIAKIDVSRSSEFRKLIATAEDLAQVAGVRG
jgi:hypothetical protein